MALPEHVAPNELIESAWGNDVVDSLTNLDTVVRRATGVSPSGQGPISMTNLALSTTSVQPSGAGVQCGTWAFDRLIIATVSMLVVKVSGTDNAMDVWVQTAAGQGGRRVRIGLTAASAAATSVHLTWLFNLPAGTGAVVQARVSSATSGGVVVSTAGASDLNYIQLAAIPAASFQPLNP